MPVNSTEEILSSIKKLNETVHVSLRKIPLSEAVSWFYDEESGEIHNQSRSFFQITGLQITENNNVITEQPIIIQDEIGYLGIIRKKINGETHYLMQYKIEPGNINKIQISPTIQATKSNFTQMHGGKKPAYLEYFINAKKYKVIVDQIQSEQSSRFLAKRNRNIIIEIEDDIEVLPSHEWMTLNQIKELMRYDNLVNMDTRTVLSCLPFSAENYYDSDLNRIRDKELYNSAVNSSEGFSREIFSYINDIKMFDNTKKQTVPLFSMKNWEMCGNEFICREPYSFKLVFCDIEIEGREVRHWCQPLFEATGIALFGLFTYIEDDIRYFIVKCKPEVGCFDKVELGPTVQRESISSEEENEADKLFLKKLENKEGIMFDTLLSEEGGRFYCEQNRNVIIEIKKDEIKLPKGYFSVDFKTLNSLVQINNILNIQLRNLLSVLEF